MLTLIKMKWIVMLFLLLYTAGSYLHCAVLYGDILAQKYTIVLDFKDTPVAVSYTHLRVMHDGDGNHFSACIRVWLQFCL